MAVNTNVLRRPSDRNLFLWTAVLFPLFVLFGYFKSYYFSVFFDVKAVANALVHAHGIIMTLWVVYFVAQVALIRSKNIKLHMTMGMVGIALAAIVVIVGMATAYDAMLLRGSAPPGINPYSFFMLPVGDMAMFVLFFAGAVYYRKRPAEHKTLMLMTAINFLPAALARASFIPGEYLVLWMFGVSGVIAVICFAWYTLKHRKLNKVFLIAVILFTTTVPPRMAFAETQIWLQFVGWLAGLSQ